MAVKKFKFVSPGVFLKEVDQSQIPRPVAPGSYSEVPELAGQKVKIRRCVDRARHYLPFLLERGERIADLGELQIKSGLLRG